MAKHPITIRSRRAPLFIPWHDARQGFENKKFLVFFHRLFRIIEDSTSFFVFIVMLGFFYSAPFSLYTPFLGDIFGRHAVGTLTGAITLGHGIIGGVGPYLWGWLADTTGSYAANCLISAGCYGIVTVFIWMIRPGEATVKA